MFEKIGQLTNEQFKALTERKFKELVKVPAGVVYQMGDTVAAIKNAELHGVYKQTHKGRNLFYLVVEVLDERLAFTWTLYPAYVDPAAEDEKIKVYTVACGEVGCTFDSLDAAVEFLKDEIEAAADGLELGQKTDLYHIKVSEMTEEEYKNLPEFDGF